MAFDQHAANLVDTTVNAFNGDTTVISPMDGISLIDSWISTLRNGGQSTNPVANGLNELKTELQSGNPDRSRVWQILDDLADQANQAAMSADNDVKTKLDSLVGALQGFSQQLGGSSTMAAMNTEPSDTVMPGQSGRQAPMTSTVGGESTNGGTGTSALGMGDEDQLSNRSGGTTNKGSAGDDYSANSGNGSSGGRSQY